MPGSDLSFNITALDNASKTFVKMADQVERLSKRIDKLDGKEAEIELKVNDTQAQRKLANIGRQAERTASRSGNRIARALLNPVVLQLGTLPAAAATAAAGTASALGGVTAGFAGIAIAAHASTEEVKHTYVDMASTIVEETRDLSESVVPYLQGVPTQVLEAFDSIKPALRDIFEAVGPQITTVTDGLLTMARNALPGLRESVLRSGVVFEGFHQLLSDVGTGTSEFFSILSEESIAAGSGLESLGGIARRAMQATGRLAAQFTSAWAQVGPEFSRLVDSLLGVAESFSAGFLESFVGAFEVGAQAVSSLAQAIKPIADNLGGLVGTVLGFAAAWKLVAGPAKAVAKAFAGLSLAKMGQRFGGFAEKVTGTGLAMSMFGGETGRSQEKLSKFSRVMRGIGRSLPIVGGVLIGGAVAFEQLTSSAGELASTLMKGTRESFRKVKYETRSFNEVMGSSRNGFWLLDDVIQSVFGPSMEDVRGEVRKTRQSWSVLERAQFDAKLAQDQYLEAVKRFGENSPQAQAAQRNYAKAVDHLESQQRQAARATQSHTDKIIAQHTIMMAGVNARLGYRGSLLNIRSAHQNLTKVMEDEEATQLELDQATLRYQQSLSQAVTMAGKRAVAESGVTDEAKQVKVATIGETKEILRLARTIGTQGNPALASMVRGLSKTQLEAIGATKRVDATGQAVIELPNGKKITFKDNAPETENRVKGVDKAVNNLNGKKIRIHYNQTYAFEGAAGGMGRIPIGAFAEGGIARFAEGGKFQSMAAGAAQRVPPNTWRIIGDRSKDDEAYIPINRSARSRSLLHETAQDMGYGLMPMADGGIVNNLQFDFPQNVMSTILDKAVKGIHGMREKFTASFGGGGGNWGGVVRQALSILGLPQSWAGIAQRQIQIESGGNARAINLWDSNAARGTPSKGLLQTIGPTFHAYNIPGLGGIYNPLANVVAAMRYAMSRYGSLPSIWPTTAGYANGSWNVPRTENALVHRGEMVIPADIAGAVRSSVGQPTNIDVKVFIGNEEITNRIDTRIEVHERDSQRKIRAGRR